MHLRTAHSRRPGFTMIELLVVIALILALIAILLPSLSKIQIQAKIAQTKSTLQSIQSGLQQYYSTFKAYPPSNSNSAPGWPASGRGSAMLAEGLTGYLPGTLDGAGLDTGDNKFGFRTRKITGMGGGDIYGPYTTQDPKVLKSLSNTEYVFLDSWGHEILYYRSLRPIPDPARSPISQIFGTTATLGNDNFYFNSDDCTSTFDIPSINAMTSAPSGNAAKFFPLLSTGNNNSAVNGAVLGSDSFLLISAGPDGAYFTGDDILANVTQIVK